MRIAAILLAGALLATAEAAAKPEQQRLVLGTVWYDSRTAAVAKLDALSLEPVATSTRVSAPAWLLARSPDGSRAAFVTGEGAVQFLDLGSMRWIRRIFVGLAGATAMWRDPRRVVALTEGSFGWIYVIDPLTGRVRSTRSLRGAVTNAVRTETSLVALVAPSDRIGQARLVVVDAQGRLRSVPLPGIRAGTRVGSGQPYSARVETPGLAVDPTGTRAVVVPTTAGPLAEVDLRTLRVARYALAARSLAKVFEGGVRSAEWFGPFVAVTGANFVATGQYRSSSIGLWLVDTRDWSVRLLDGSATGAAVAGETLLSFNRETGVSGYSSDGTVRFRLFAGENAWLAAATRAYAYIGRSNDGRRFSIVDPALGTVVATVTSDRTVTIFG